MMKIFIITLCCILLFNLVGCTAQNQNMPNTTNTTLDSTWFEEENLDGSIVLYELSRNIYYEFVKNPSTDYLIANVEKICLYTKLPLDETMIARKYWYDGKVSEDQWEEGVYRIGGNIPVYSSLIDFVSDGKQLQSYLLENKIEGDIQNIILVATESLPVVIWVIVDEMNIFISIDDIFVDYENKQNTTYSYKLYTPEKYCDFILPENATLFVNTHEVMTGNYVITEYDYTKVPILTVLNKLGALIIWQNADIVHIFYNGKAYVFDLLNATLVEKSTENNLYPKRLIGGGARYAKYGNGVVVLDDFLAKCVFENLSIGIKVDDQNKTVMVTGDTCYGWMYGVSFLIVEWIVLLVLFLRTRRKHPLRAKLIKVTFLSQIVILAIALTVAVLWYLFGT